MSDRYLAPDFYKHFRCLCGKCRHCCCGGWEVRISEAEYFRLLGCDCSVALRRKIDGAFSVPNDADPEAYALLNRNYLGSCPLQREDGLCALQRELGEDSLPAVCRLYPRSIHPELGEAALSASCEAVASLLLHRYMPYRLTRQQLLLPATGSETPQRLTLRLKCIEQMQDRRLNLRYRILELGRLIDSAPPQYTPFDRRLRALTELTELYRTISPSLGEYCAVALARMRGKTPREFGQAADAFGKRFPHMSVMMEQLLVNHMFYVRFPFNPDTHSVSEAYAALSGLAGFLHLLCVGNGEQLADTKALTDLVAAVFRAVEHGHFDHNAFVVLRETEESCSNESLQLQ